MIEIKSMSLSIANPITTLKPPVIVSPIEVRGEMRVYFESSALLEWAKREHGRQRNEVLRLARPHMPRRMWQRLRGKLRARGKAS